MRTPSVDNDCSGNAKKDKHPSSLYRWITVWACLLVLLTVICIIIPVLTSKRQAEQLWADQQEASLNRSLENTAAHWRDDSEAFINRIILTPGFISAFSDQDKSRLVEIAGTQYNLLAESLHLSNFCFITDDGRHLINMENPSAEDSGHNDKPKIKYKRSTLVQTDQGQLILFVPVYANSSTIIGWLVSKSTKGFIVEHLAEELKKSVALVHHGEVTHIAYSGKSKSSDLFGKEQVLKTLHRKSPNVDITLLTVSNNLTFPRISGRGVFI